MDDVAEKLSSRQALSGPETALPLRQIDLEVELLERKVRLFLGRAELIEKRDQLSSREIQDDVNAIRDKWDMLLKVVDVARRDEAENERLRQQAAQVHILAVNLSLLTAYNQGSK